MEDLAFPGYGRRSRAGVTKFGQDTRGEERGPTAMLTLRRESPGSTGDGPHSGRRSPLSTKRDAGTGAAGVHVRPRPWRPGGTQCAQLGRLRNTYGNRR